VIPLVYVGISILIIFTAYTYTSLSKLYRHYTYRSNTAKLLATTDDESIDSDDEVITDEDISEGENSESTLIDSLPQHTKIAIIEDKPHHAKIWVAAECLLLAGQAGLSIFSIIKGEGWRSIAIAGHFQWVYLFGIALLRCLGTQRTRRLWTHSMLIYLFLWPIAFILLRSAIIRGGEMELRVQIANMCLVTGLCALVLTSRAGNKPVKLVSTNGLEPTRVSVFITGTVLNIVFVLGTDGKFVVSRYVCLG